jgi:hypothetical protein
MKTARFGLSAGLGLIVALAAVPGLGAQQRLSPPDSSELELAGRQIKVAFSSPSVRDRVIFGGLVPWNQVWRTGANEATSFSTEANLRIGDAEVPAGDYTLYTIPGTDEWTLIVSRQTRQWGTEYHPDMDLARVEMEVEELEEPVESFRIVLYPRGPDEGTLLLEWASTRASVPFKVLR